MVCFWRRCPHEGSAGAVAQDPFDCPVLSAFLNFEKVRTIPLTGMLRFFFFGHTGCLGAYRNHAFLPYVAMLRLRGMYRTSCTLYPEQGRTVKRCAVAAAVNVAQPVSA